MENRLDSRLVQHFVRTMGVYPPGTVVRLSDESIVLVVAVDPEALPRPQVLLYNPNIPPHDALLVDLTEHDELSVLDALKPGDYPQRIYEYLGIQQRIGYFYDRRGQEV